MFVPICVHFSPKISQRGTKSLKSIVAVVCYNDYYELVLVTRGLYTKRTVNLKNQTS